MADTPEGKVKKLIDKVLNSAEYVYFKKPVLGPYGSTGLDYEGCSRGRFFVIEAKAPTKNAPTERQQGIMDLVVAAGGTAFFINGKPEQLEALKAWLDSK